MAWQGARYSLSALGTWHRGWPRTPYVIEPGRVTLGSRNSERWSDFYSLDLRGSYRWQVGHGDLTATLELTNATNRDNECCALIERDDDTQSLTAEIDHWLPTIINLGITYRWHNTR
jgi:hypothetical protein